MPEAEHRTGAGREGCVLGLETSTGQMALCLLDAGGAVLAEISEPVGRTHMARLAPAIRDLLGANGVSPRALRAIGVSAGPGSFTGLRIGMATAEGMAAAAGMSVVAVPTLRALAEGTGLRNGGVVSMVDARRGRVYTAEFTVREGEWSRQSEDHIADLDAMVRALSGRSVALAGDPCRNLAARDGWTLFPEVGAQAVAAYARRRLLEGTVGETPHILYLRGPQDAKTGGRQAGIGKG